MDILLFLAETKLFSFLLLTISFSSFNFFLNVFQTSSLRSDAEVQFAIAYGEVEGSGSAPFNTLVTGSSPSRIVYGQYRTLLLGTESGSFDFGNDIPPKSSLPWYLMFSLPNPIIP